MLLLERIRALQKWQAWYLRALLIAAIVTGIHARLDRIEAWPMNENSSRQYHGALLARRIWYRLRKDRLTPEERESARIHREGIIEPPILETLTSLGYRALGREMPSIASLLSISFWLLASGVLFSTTLRIWGLGGATLSLGFFLLQPSAVAISRSFQPESLMMLAFTLTACFWLRTSGEAWRKRIWAQSALLTSITLLIKPGILLLPLACGFASVVRSMGSPSPKRRWALAILAFGAAAAPAFAYFWMFLTLEPKGKFMPTLLLQPGFYGEWISNAHAYIGLPAIVLGALGAAIMRRRDGIRLAIGLWLGFISSCLVFTYHSMTHDYYHAPLILIVAICLAPIGRFLTEELTGWKRASAAIAIGSVFAAFAFDSRSRISFDVIELDREVYRPLCEVLPRFSKVISMGPTYGLPLIHLCHFGVVAWPSSGDRAHRALAGNAPLSAEETLKTLIQSSSAAYFVVTDLRELDQDPALKRHLMGNYRLVKRSPRFLVFDL